jgi:hypothetical protein
MDLCDNKAEYLNPINIPYFLSILMPSTLAFIFGLMNFSEGGDKSLSGAILFWSIGSFFFCGIMWKEYIHKPKSVVITDDGLLLKLRFGREVHIAWDDILWISASPGGTSEDVEGVSGRVGAIKATRGVFYMATYEVGRAAQERYSQAMGRRPMTRDQYIKLRKGRLNNISPGGGT